MGVGRSAPKRAVNVLASPVGAGYRMYGPGVSYNAERGERGNDDEGDAEYIVAIVSKIIARRC